MPDCMLSKLGNDIEKSVQAACEDILYDTQMTIHQIVDEAREKCREESLSVILHDYGHEIQKRMDETADLDDLIDQEMINTLHI